MIGNGIPAGDRDSDVDESALLVRIAAGERDAMTDLYRRYYASLFRFAFRLTRSYGTAEELVNDVMLAVWKGAGGFRRDSRVSTWIFGIAYRQCVSVLRRKRISIAPDIAVEALADESMADLECGEWLENGLATLPNEQRISMLLVFYLGCSYSEVAEITGCKEATVKTRMFHARRKLREALPRLARPATAGDV